jgi:NAD+ synthase (glutamine-hydrolysing)
MYDGFVSVAAGTPEIRVADCAFNAKKIIAMMRDASERGVNLLVLPELCVTGYTCGDLFFQRTLLDGARAALRDIAAASSGDDMITLVGFPAAHGGRLYNCAAVVQDGELLGIIPKTHIPNYGEFYEKRQFASGGEPDADGVMEINGNRAIFCAKTVFRCEELPEFAFGVEICEDLWAPDPPSVGLAASGAAMICNLSASNDMIGKGAYRRSLVAGRSASLLCGYVYASAGDGESTSDVVFGAHRLIAENGVMLAESRFESGLTISEIDVKKLDNERRRTQIFERTCASAENERRFSMKLRETKLTRRVASAPFVPSEKGDRAARCDEILRIASSGLKTRLGAAGAKCAVVGLSGGLDSTLAILITKRAMDMLGRPASDVLAVTMPCFGTTDRTKDNATLLAERLGAELMTIDIGKSVRQHFADIGHDMDDHSVTFENGQARERTQVLMDIANKRGGIVIGTGDLSELALGWATYNGDHMSMYGVNCSIPKTLVRWLVDFAAGEAEKTDTALAGVLRDILATPVSPELLPPENGIISQKTEDIVGPYELHDFFLYYAVRWAFPPKKIFRLAKYAFGGAYPDAEIKKWLGTFYRRFFAQQFKRNCLPDGPKVGTVALSPRGDWRMPSDAGAELWMKEIEEIKA